MPFKCTATVRVRPTAGKCLWPVAQARELLLLEPSFLLKQRKKPYGVRAGTNSQDRRPAEAAEAGPPGWPGLHVRVRKS